MNDNNNNDKPFECTQKGCLQKFSTEDHLSVHLKRHEMKLKFSALNPNDKISIVDQTPTPSRILGNFLETWNEVGLNSEIQEISNLTPYLNDTTTQTKSADTNTSNSKSSSADNPFVNAFKNALNSNNLKIPEHSHRILTTISDSPLNTPSIFPNEGLMAIANAALHPLNTPDPDFHLDTNGDKNLDINVGNSVNNSVSDLNSPSIVNTTAKNTISGLIKVQPKNGEPLKTSNDINGTVKTTKGQRFQAVPVIRTANTSVNSNNISISPTLPNIIISQPNNKIIKTINTTKLRTVPIAQTTKTTAIIAPKMKEPALSVSNANNSLYKVILKLPDGRSVQLPLIQQPITPTAIQPTFTAITNKTNDLNSISTNNMIIGSTISSQPKQTSSSNSSLSTLQSKVDATLAALPPKAKPGRKSKFAPEEDPREKKARSLERNRAAAMRCRLKRKHWIDSLEEKADEYEKINEKLQSEVVALRREVTLLKTALLAHKDCPVTLQQQKVSGDFVSPNVVTITATNGNSHKLNNNMSANGLT